MASDGRWILAMGVVMGATAMAPPLHAGEPIHPHAVITEAPLVAADRLEQLARRHPDAPLAADAMRRSVALRLKFDAPARIDESVALYRKLFGASGLELAELELSYVTHVLEAAKPRRFTRKVPTRVAKALGLLSKLERHTSPVVRWPALVLRARYQERHDTHSAPTGQHDPIAAHRVVAREFTSIRSLNKHLDALASAGLGGTRTLERQRRERALNAVGEALWSAAEDARRALSHDVPMPSPNGVDDHMAAITRHIDKKVQPWSQGARRKARTVANAYRRLRLLRSYGARWQTKAAAGEAMMWAELVSAFRAAPYPKTWDRDGFVRGLDPPTLWAELRASYLAQLDIASEPEKRLAKRSALRCLAVNARLQAFDPSATDCEEWLAKNYPSEHPLIDELFPHHVRRSKSP